MAYPPYYVRLSNFLQTVQAGGVWDQTTAAALDAELNAVVTSLSAELAWVRNITSSDNRLKNVASATALSLVGTERVVATSNAQVVFDTNITWDASFTVNNVVVNWIVTGSVIGQILDTTQYAVSNNGGKLRVTITPVTVASGDAMVIRAYCVNSSLQTRLASTAHGDGASMVGVEDSGGLYVGTTNEECLAEIRTLYNATVSALGTIADLWRKDGADKDGTPISATDDWDMGDNEITSLADGTANDSAATVGQVVAATQGLLDLTQYFLRKDVAVAWESDQNANSHKLAGLIMTATDGATAGEAANQPYVDAKVTGLQTQIDAITSGSGATAAGMRQQTFPTPGSGVGFSFTVPSGVSVVRAEVWGGGAGGCGYSGGAYGGGSGAYAMANLTVVENDVITFAIGSGGDASATATSAGGDSVCYLNGVEVIRGKGGATATPSGPWDQGGLAVIAASPKIISSLGIAGDGGDYTSAGGQFAKGGQAPYGGGCQGSTATNPAGRAPGGGGGIVYGYTGGPGGNGLGRVTY